MSDLVGSKLGDYEIKSLLAVGGMAKVYRAFDVRLEREIAVKVLTQELVESDPTLSERFKREARAIANLEHPNIIPVYRSGEEKNLHYMAMKLIEGEDFADEIRGFYKKKTLMSPERMIFIMQQVASALDFAHASGVIHRDIKPSNILINKNGQAILSDFGLVLRLEVDKTLGTAFGTPRYISPEQAISSEDVVPQSDIYSLAVIIFEVLTGHMLFSGDNPMQVALSHISEEPPSPRSFNPNIPEAVEKELLKSLEKEPSKRHQTAGELVASIKAAYGDLIDHVPNTPLPLMAAQTPVFRPVSQLSDSLTQKLADVGVPKKRIPLVLWGFVATLLFIMAAAAMFLLRNKDPIVLRYDGRSIVLVNQSSKLLDIRELIFSQEYDGRSMTFESREWDTSQATGSREAMDSKNCYQLWKFEYVTIPVDEYPANNCNRQAYVRTSRPFWINQVGELTEEEEEEDRGGDVFTVKRGSDLLAICDTAIEDSRVEISCSFDLEP